MEFKVGDEVLVKGIVSDIYEDGDIIVSLIGADGNKYTKQICPDKSILVKDMTAEEAWELVNFITTLKVEDKRKIFGYYCSCEDIINTFSYEEAKEKIKEWEKSNKFDAGDEVIPKDGNYRNGECGIVVVCSPDESIGVIHRGNDFTWYKKDSLKKTGRHIDFNECMKHMEV